MAQELGQSHFPPPHFPISSSASPSSSEHDSLFSPPPANSAITTPSVTPDRDLVRPGATGQSNQKLTVERVDARPESSQHEESQPQHYTLTQPPTQSTRFRPYPPEMYAPSQAYPTVPYTYPGGVASYQPSMVQPGMGMVPGQFSSPPPGVYAPPQHMGPYVPYPYAYSQPPYIAPAPQTINPAVSYTFPLTQAVPAPVAPVNPLVAVSADQVQAAAPTRANASQTLVHQGPVTQTATAVAHPAQAGGMMYTCPTADATYFYNLGLMHSTLGYVQSVGNDGQPVMQPPAPQQQQYPQTQGYVPTDIYAAMGQQIVSSNAGSVQQTAPVASSSVRRKWKHRIMNDGAAKPKIHPVINDPDFKNVGDEKNPIYECQRPQCKKLRMQAASVFHHRRSKKHSDSENLLSCEGCGDRLSRSDGLKRHVRSGRCLRNQQANIKKGLTPSGNTPTLQFPDSVPPVPFTYEAARSGLVPTLQQASAPLGSAQDFTPAVESTVQALTAAPSVIQQQSSGPPPLPVFAVEFKMQVTAQARPELPPQPSCIPALPEFSVPVVQVTGQAPKPDIPQKASGVPPPPVVAADFSISTPKMAEDEIDLFGSPLPAEAVVEGDTADTVASIPGFDATAYDISFDDWMNETEQAAPAVFADTTVDFFGH